MLRANSDKGAYYYNDDDDDNQQQQPFEDGGMSEMLRSISNDYYSNQNDHNKKSRDNSNNGSEVNANNTTTTVNEVAALVASEDEIGAIGDEDQEVDIDFKDPVEQHFFSRRRNNNYNDDDASDAEDPDSEYFDMFKLVKSDNKSKRIIDPRHWQLNVTVSSSNNNKAATAAAATSSENDNNNSNKTTIQKMIDSESHRQQQQQLQNKNDDDDDDDASMGMGKKSETFTIEISPEEGTEMFLEEIEAIKIVYGEENVVIEENSNEKSQMMTIKIQVLSPTDLEEAEEKRNRKSKGLWISFVKPIRYPIAPLEPFVEPYNNIFSFQEAQLIYKGMVETAENERNAPCLFNMVQTAAGLASTFIAEGCSLIDDSKKDYIAEQMKKAGFNVRLGHEKLSPSFFIGSIAKVMGKIPKGFDVVYVENVMRVDLAKRFEAMQRHLFKVHVAGKLGRQADNVNQNNNSDDSNSKQKKNNNNKKQKEGSDEKDKEEGGFNLLRSNPALASLCDARAVFHGTRNAFVESIVAKGLKVPQRGKNAEVKVRIGSRYGAGIYSTPDPSLACCYAENGRRNEYSVKILVCAVLQGKPNRINDGEEPWGGGLIDPDEKGYNSHESEDGSQIVVFNAAQILPCYVLHLMERRARASNVSDLGRGNKTEEVAREMKRIEEEYGINAKHEELELKRKQGGKLHNKRKVGMAALADAERKKILTALARKNLPFGFGPGNDFVVEEIAEVSDDDEDLDEYVGVGHEGAEVYEEYQIAREHDTTEVQKQKFDPYNQLGRKTG